VTLVSVTDTDTDGENETVALERENVIVCDALTVGKLFDTDSDGVTVGGGVIVAEDDGSVSDLLPSSDSVRLRLNVCFDQDSVKDVVLLKLTLIVVVPVPDCDDDGVPMDTVPDRENVPAEADCDDEPERVVEIVIVTVAEGVGGIVRDSEALCDADVDADVDVDMVRDDENVPLADAEDDKLRDADTDTVNDTVRDAEVDVDLEKVDDNDDDNEWLPLSDTDTVRVVDMVTVPDSDPDALSDDENV